MTAAKISAKGDCNDITPYQLEEILAVPHFLTRRRFLKLHGCVDISIQVFSNKQLPIMCFQKLELVAG